MTRSNLTNLAADAYRHGEATASNGRWRAHRTDHDSVIVGHYATAMIEIHYNHGMADRVEALDAGWGSMTDKTGIGQIVRAEKVAASYADVFASH